MAHFMSQYCVSWDFVFHSGGFGSKGLMNRLSRALHLTVLNPLRISQFHISLLMMHVQPVELGIFIDRPVVQGCINRNHWGAHRRNNFSKFIDTNICSVMIRSVKQEPTIKNWAHRIIKHFVKFNALWYYQSERIVTCVLSLILCVKFWQLGPLHFIQYSLLKQ
jgi:hypothetical protein